MKQYPDDLADEQWDQISDLIPKSTARTGRPAKDPRLMLDGIFWILSAGTRWRQLDSRFGPHQTVFGYFAKWRRDGVFAKIVEKLQVDLDKKGLIDWDLWCIDGSNVRASKSAAGAEKKSLDRDPQEPADHALGRSKGGFGTKFHLVTDGEGTPLAVKFTAGEVSESTQVESVIGAALQTLMAKRRERRGRKHKPDQAAGDKGYSARRVRDWLIGQAIEPVIPHKENEKARHDIGTWFDRVAYCGRSVIEQCIGWLKEYRRIGTRYEKLELNFEAMFQLAMVKRYFRLLF